jgi:phosphoglycolate phosphatase
MGAAVVFDLDGTLIDSAPDICAIANAVLADKGAGPLSLDETRGFIGNGARVFVTRMIAARGLSPALLDDLQRDFVQRYDDAHDLTVIYPGVVAALDDLAAQGQSLGICTNKPLSPALSVLDHFGLRSRFTSIVGGDSLPQTKPDPAPLLHCFAALPGRNRVYVGDSEVDHQTAIAAGIDFALYTQGYRKTPVEAFAGAVPFSDYATLPALIGQLLRADPPQPRRPFDLS